MSALPPLLHFIPLPPDPNGIISWIHIGDLHITERGLQNHVDLLSIIEEINRAFKASICFAYLPGDIAEHGDVAAYSVVREALHQLQLPWCSVLGDHDVHERSFTNYLQGMGLAKYYAFQVGQVQFLALNAFEVPDPRSFCLLEDQLSWLEQELEPAGTTVLFLHCYPSDLKQGGGQLRSLIEKSAVRLIDRGHTHYNEVANDGRTLYTATRSTGQIEEGPVGFSVTNIDGEVISWKFFHLRELPVLMITSPADERFITDPSLQGHVAGNSILVRAKAWGEAVIQSAIAQLEGMTVSLQRVGESHVWQGELLRGELPDGVYPLTVSVKDANG